MRMAPGLIRNPAGGNEDRLEGENGRVSRESDDDSSGDLDDEDGPSLFVTFKACCSNHQDIDFLNGMPVLRLLSGLAVSLHISEAKTKSRLPEYTAMTFGAWVEGQPPHPPDYVTIGGFTRQSPPPHMILSSEAENWKILLYHDLEPLPNGNLAHLILLQLVRDEERTLRAYTNRSPNLLVYSSRLLIVYYAIGAVATTAWWYKTVHCIIFPHLSHNKMKILTELVSAHGGQLYRCTNNEYSRSWVQFNGREELANLERVHEGVARATEVTSHFY
jgi:hypothetical protein